MAVSLTSLSHLAELGADTIIDVRAPAEFALDHIPGAINLPVLSDEERARVGTLYVQDSPFAARKIGAALVARNAAAHIEKHLMGFDGGWQPLVYCWRGGQRSGSFAMLLTQIGWRVNTIEGGYQSYRRLVVQRVYDAPFPSPVILLDGNTGTAKTEVLARLSKHGVQSIDLEGLANHRGSALGGFGSQPSQKAFETALAREVDTLDPSKPVVIEAEGSRVGALGVPPAVLSAMKDAPRIEISAPIEARARYLTRAYADLAENVPDSIERLQKLVGIQGREKVALWCDMVRDGAHEDLARCLIEDHYDPRYRKVREAKAGPDRQVITANDLKDADITNLATQVAEIVKARAGAAVAG